MSYRFDGSIIALGTLLVGKQRNSVWT